MNDEEAELRRAIERDRERLAETASAIARKADVAAQARARSRPLIAAGAIVLALVLLAIALRRR